MNSSIEILKKQLECGFLPQAYLFWGNDNKTKEKAIEYILASLLGDNFRTHSNFYEAVPEKNDNGKGSISIESMRDLRARAFQKPFDENKSKFGAKNVFLIREIDLLQYDASSVLLKLLEEPPEGAFFLATTTNRTAILSTIKSRFLMLRFWNNAHQTQFEQIEYFKKMSYFERCKEIPKIIEKGSLDSLLLESLMLMEDKMRLDIIKGDGIHKSVDALERLLLAYREMTNPTINKRLLGEYCAMLI
ncbi:MAG: hypothetical protein AAB795_04290 [Patescibacteria group bacterium]